MSDLYKELKQKFSVANCKHITKSDFDLNEFPHCKFNEYNKIKKCAVLILLFKSNYVMSNELCILFTIRSSSMRSFPGEICYPGGKFDHRFDKTYVDTALREAKEEIGLKKENVRIICQLCPMLSPFGHYIVPIVGLLENNKVSDSWHLLKQLKASPKEVELIFWVPVKYITEALKSNELFNQHISPINYSILKLDYVKYNLPELSVRNIFEITEEYFKNELNKLDKIIPINTFLYGINSHLAIFVSLLVDETSDFECKFGGKINYKNVLDYLRKIILTSYLIFKINIAEKALTSKL